MGGCLGRLLFDGRKVEAACRTDGTRKMGRVLKVDKPHAGEIS